jgi:hypothetical protein
MLQKETQAIKYFVTGGIVLMSYNTFLCVKRAFALFSTSYRQIS